MRSSGERTSTDIYLRDFQAGDEDSIVNLFNSQHQGLGGFVPRTIQYWRWCCLQRPDVTMHGIQVAEKGNRLVGYVVVGNSGNVWELCYDPHFGGENVVSSLLEYALSYVKSVDNDSIELNAFSGDQIVRNVCRELGFAESPSEPVFLSVLDLPELIRAVLKAKIQKERKDEVFWFRLKNCPSWCIDSFGIMLRKNEIVILKETNLVSKVTIDIEMSTLVALIFGARSVVRTVFSSKIHFDHMWNVFKVIRFMRLLQVKADWSIPRADIN